MALSITFCVCACGLHWGYAPPVKICVSARWVTLWLRLPSVCLFNWLHCGCVPPLCVSFHLKTIFVGSLHAAYFALWHFPHFSSKDSIILANKLVHLIINKILSFDSQTCQACHQNEPKCQDCPFMENNKHAEGSTPTSLVVVKRSNLYVLLGLHF